MFKILKLKLFALTVLSSIINSVVELLLSIFFALLISLVVNGENDKNSKIFDFIKNLAINLEENVIYTVTICFLILIIVRFIASLINSYISGIYVFETYSKIVKIHLTSLIFSNFNKIKSTNVSTIVNAVDNESKTISNWFHMPLIVIINESLLLLLYLIFIFNHININLLFVLIFCFTYITISFSLIIFQQYFTFERKNIDRNVVMYIDRFVSSIGKIKLSSSINYFTNLVLNQVKLKKNSWIIHQSFGNLMKLFLETPILLFFCALIYYSTIKQLKFSGDFAIFLLLAFMRISPIISKIMTAASQINYCLKNHKTDELIISINENKFKKDELIKKIVKIKLINFSPVKNGLILIEPLNHEFVLGNVALITGPSGVGKTSMIECIAGLSNEYVGKIKYIFDDGLELESTLLFSDKVEYVFQNEIQFFQNFIDNILWDSVLNEAKLNEIISLFNLNEIFDRNSSTLNTFTNLTDIVSGGQNQRLSLARAFYSLKNIILLDEPTSALDFVNKKRFVSHLLNNSSNSIFIVISHDPDLINSTDLNFIKIILTRNSDVIN